MSYLELLKQENMHHGELTKLTKPPFVSFVSTVGRNFSKNDIPRSAPRTRDMVDSLSCIRTLNDIENQVPELPAECPLLGGPFPVGCKFESRFFKRMVSEGTLPLPDGRCPLQNICGLNHQKDDLYIGL